MNAIRKEVEREIRHAPGAAEIVIDLENKAYARGWADGIDSTEHVEGGMYVVAFGAVALVGGIVGAIITALIIW
jgi:hypothetical protein